MPAIYWISQFQRTKRYRCRSTALFKFVRQNSQKCFHFYYAHLMFLLIKSAYTAFNGFMFLLWWFPFIYIQKIAIALVYQCGTIESSLDLCPKWLENTFSLKLSWYIQKFTKFVTVKISADRFYRILVFIAQSADCFYNVSFSFFVFFSAIYWLFLIYSLFKIFVNFRRPQSKLSDE